MTDLIGKMENRAEALRDLARHPWITAEGCEALAAAADLYEARAANMRVRASA